ncbi:hypothetical protein [Candidatus Methylobacter favarea]|uniref:hypothetical protein n=1 Tax=Candidatus Methylobacter favarea TaxID=2707345 RepID=UPI00157C7908|nr:hypothetical protein [Candidatus Methylobacter favarea]
MNKLILLMVRQAHHERLRQPHHERLRQAHRERLRQGYSERRQKTCYEPNQHKPFVLSLSKEACRRKPVEGLNQGFLNNKAGIAN